MGLLERKEKTAMNAEFFAALEQLEKEKGIPQAYMLEKIEAALLSAFKKAEDGEGYVLRAYECAGKAVSCEIDCKTLGVYTVDFTPYEAKTLRIQNGKIKEVLFTEYDLSES